MHPPQHPGASAHLHLPEGMAALAGAFMAAVNGTEAANAGTHGLMPDLGTLTNAMAAASKLLDTENCHAARCLVPVIAIYYFLCLHMISCMRV